MMAEHHRPLGTTLGIVSASAVLARAESRAVRLRTREHVVLVRRIAPAIDGLALLIERGLLGQGRRDAMQIGDGVLFYHSNTQVPGIVGIASVASHAYPDETQFDPKSDYHDPKATREQPRWFLVDVAFERKLARTIPLDEIKQHAEALGEAFPLVARGSRLSVFPVTAAQWKLLLSLE